MKTVRKDKQILRVSDAVAAKMVAKDGYRYCGKEVWKKEVRGPVEKTEPNEPGFKRKLKKRGVLA